MANFRIISDSSCDIPEELLTEYDIELILFYVSFDKENYLKERFQLSIEDFYQQLETEKIFPKTSMPSVQDYLDIFTPYAKKGMNILCLCLTSKFSGSYQSAVNAMNIIKENYKDINIYVIDSHQSTIGQGLLVVEAARMRNDGLSIEKTVENIDKLKDGVRVQFTVDSLEYLQMGGRIGKVSALAGSILNVKPLIVMKERELIPYGIIRGRKKALIKIVDMTKEDLKGKSYDDYRFGMALVYAKEEANKVKTTLKNDLGIELDYPYFRIGTTIGTNTGSTALGIAYIQKYETL